MPRWLVCALAAACVLPTIVVLRERGDAALAGPATAAQVLVITAGLLLVGAAAWARAGRELEPRLFAIAAGAWLASEWANPGAPGALIFTAGLIATGLPLPAVIAAAMSSARAERWAWSGAVALSAAAAAWLIQGPLVALTVDPRAAGCTDCPRDLIYLASTGVPLERIGAWVSLAACAAGVAMLVITGLRAWKTGRTWVMALVLPAATFVAVTAIGTWIALRDGAADPGVRTAHLIAAGALVAVCLGSRVRPLRLRRARRAVAATTTAMAASPHHVLTQALAPFVGDDELVIAYHVPQFGWLDVAGRPIDLPRQPSHRRATVIAETGSPIAALVYRSELVLDEDLLADALAAGRLALDVERLQVAVLGRLEQLREARARVIDATDEARRLLERDLHDGAQQRLVGLRFSLGLVQARADAAGLRDVSEQVSLIDASISQCLDALRELAHGLYPACLDTDGLCAALHDAADRGNLALRLGALPARRLPPHVERTAYRVVTDVLSVAADHGARSARVQADDRDARLVVLVEHDAPDGDALIKTLLSDRVAAADGTLHVERQALRATVTAELPCA